MSNATTRLKALLGADMVEAAKRDATQRRMVEQDTFAQQAAALQISAQEKSAQENLAQQDSVQQEPVQQSSVQQHPAKQASARLDSAQQGSVQQDSAQQGSAQQDSVQQDSAQRDPAQRKSTERRPVRPGFIPGEPARRVPEQQELQLQKLTQKEFQNTVVESQVKEEFGLSGLSFDEEKDHGELLRSSIGFEDSDASDEYPVTLANTVRPGGKARHDATKQGVQQVQHKLRQEAPPDMHFCPILAVARFSYRYMSKGLAEAQKVSEEFFASGKVWEREWTL